MFDWLKPKKKPTASAPLSPPSSVLRDDLVRDAIRNTKMAQDKMGKETIDRLARIINAGKTLSVDSPSSVISPADQAKKIIAHMDKTKLGRFMTLLVPDDQTKH